MFCKHKYGYLDLTSASLEHELVITVETPSGGVELVLKDFGKDFQHS